MKKILLFLAEGFEFYEAAAFIDVFGWNRSAGAKNTEIVSCGLTKTVKSAFNQKIIVDCLISDISDEDIESSFDALAIPGGFKGFGFYKCAYNEKVLNLIRAFDRNDKFIATVCVGILPVGKSGILVNRKATVYDQEDGIYKRELKSYRVIVTDDDICDFKNIISSKGPETAPAVALHLLEKLTSPETREFVEKMMGF